MHQLAGGREPQFQYVDQNQSPQFQNETPRERRRETRPRYESLPSSQDFLYNGMPSSWQTPAAAPQRSQVGGKRIIFTSLALIAIPMIGLAALLLGLVISNSVEKPGDESSGSLTLDLRSQFHAGAYYVDFNPTTLVTIASWSSTVAPLLAVCAMILVSFPLARSLKANSQSSKSESLPTPFQFSLLLDSLFGGVTPLWNAFSYRRWSHRDVKMASNVRNAITVLAIFTALGYTIAGVDTWLHLVMKAVNIELADAQAPQQALGRGLPEGPCSNQSTADFDAGDCIINKDGTNVFLVNANEGAKVMSNTSSTNAVYDMYISDKHFAYLGPSNNPSNLDYRAESLAVHTSCTQIGKKCNLGVNQSGASEPFHCTDAFYGDLAQPVINGLDSDGVTGLAFRSAGIVFYRDAGLTRLANISTEKESFTTRPSNPQHLAAWAKVELQATNEQTADGNVVTPTHGGTSWLLNCSATAYQITYDFINGSLQHATAELANGSVGTILNTGNYYGFGKVALETAAYSASQYNETAQMAESWARAYSRTAVALGAGIMTAREDLEEQVRSTKLVSRVPKAPLYTLVCLNTVYALLGVILALMALASNPREMNELREKLSTAGLVALCFEGERAERVVDKKREMFAEYAGEVEARVGVEQTIGRGEGHIFRLRRGIRKSVS